MNYKNRLIPVLFVLAVIAMSISGCDRHKAEREEISKQIAAIDADTAPLKEEQGRLAKDEETLNIEIQQQSNTLQQHLDQRAKLQEDLSAYVKDHQTTALVLKLTKTSVAAVLESKADQKTKDLIKNAGAIGNIVAMAYCLRKGEECRNATIQIVSLGSQIDSENEVMSGINIQIDQKKASLPELQQKRSTVDAAIAQKTQERDRLKQKLDSL
jgi:chromosome segregation ATPase